MQLRRGIDWLGKPLAVGCKAADMVHMVVSDEYGAERVLVQSVAHENLLETPEAHPGIHKDSVPDSILLIFKIIAIPATAARKTHETHHCSASSQYFLITPYASATPSSPAWERSMQPFSLSFR